MKKAEIVEVMARAMDLTRCDGNREKGRDYHFRARAALAALEAAGLVVVPREATTSELSDVAGQHADERAFYEMRRTRRD